MDKLASAETASNFYPRPPRGGRHVRHFFASIDHRFLSTPSARRATPLPGENRLGRGISIHALREEGDRRPRLRSSNTRIFLSTPSARRATLQGVPTATDWEISIHALREEGDPSDYRPNAWTGDFYPRPPRGGRPGVVPASRSPVMISIHALREEGDVRLCRPCIRPLISIHALREEGDVFPSASSVVLINFYPRPPRGGRR